MSIRLPPGKKCIACFTFDFDGISMIGSSWPNGTTPTVLSRAEFGSRVGFRRIVDLMDKYNIKTTWFVPMQMAEVYPEKIEELYSKGHEIAHHGYAHESPAGLAYEQERAILERGIDVAKRITGERPWGYRSPGAVVTDQTTRLLIELGFKYSSHMYSDDFRIVKVRVGTRFSTTEPFELGEETSLLDIPLSAYIRSDTRLFDVGLPIKFYGDGGKGFPPSHILEIWCSEFDYMYENVEGGIYSMTSHPFSIGRGYRMATLEKLIKYISGHPDVWFARCIDVINAYQG